MQRSAACLAVWLVSGCASPATTSVPGNAASAEPRPGLVLNLYRDGAVVWDRRVIELAPGRSEISFEPVPEGIEPDSATLVSLSHPTAVRVLGPPRLQPVQPGTSRLTWTIETSKPGPASKPGSKSHLVEAAYTTDAITAQTSYVLTVDARHRRGSLRATLLVDNRTAVDMQPTAVRVTGSSLAEPGGDPTWFALDEPVTVAARATRRYPMLGQGREVATALRLFYDPIGAEFDHHGVRPATAQNYAIAAPARDSTTVHQRIEIDHDSAPWIGDLPAGEMQIVAAEPSKPGPEKAPLGRGMAFASGHDAGVNLEPAPGWRARRWQSDFLHDPHARRVVEEIRVKIESPAGEPAVVVVREHLYRGLNWTVAYHNEVVVARKEGPQTVRFEVAVPAGKSALLVYRVVYTW